MGWQEEVRRLRGPDAWAGHIPAPLTALVGRAHDVEAVTRMLRRSRLVTLTGPGGVGKTRTAVELGRRHVRQFADEIRLIDLDPVSATEDLADAVARLLGIGAAAGSTTIDALRRYVTDRDVLLLMDNCDHVLEASAELCAALLDACSGLRILATCREPLGITGEAVWRLGPLLPPDGYRLFLERAREARPELVPDDDTEAAVLGICARLDNLPLGIELAAARVRVMSPEEILSSLDIHSRELSRPRGPAPPRHRNVRAAVEWSYDLLDPPEQRAFRSLAVFVSGFDADAARDVAGMSLDMLARLVDKSLIVVIPARRRGTRYRLLDTVREYAGEQLAAADEVTATRSRHLRFFSGMEAPPEDAWMPAGVVSFLEERAADYGNVRTAVEWAAVADPCAAMRLLARTKDLFFMLGQADGKRLAALVLQRCAERGRHRLAVKIAAGHFAFLLGDASAAEAHMTEAARMSVELEERAFEGAAHWFLGLHQMFAGSPSEARSHLTRARAVQQEIGDVLGEARTTAALGLTLLIEHQPGPARQVLESALAIGTAAEDRWSQGQAHLYLGILAESSAESRAASSFFRRAVECLGPYRDSTLFPVALIGQASVMTPRDPATALEVIAAAWTARARNGGGFPPFLHAFAQRARDAAARGVGGDSARVWEHGSRLTVDEAAALAFGGGTRPRVAGPSGLSERELVVLGLVTEGLTNREIARRMHISTRTVESHVRHALAKTGLVNRTQLAAWAHERDLPPASVVKPQSH